jgi:hypothetical protein
MDLWLFLVFYNIFYNSCVDTLQYYAILVETHEG